jgi:hypothetical protein
LPSRRTTEGTDSWRIAQPAANAFVVMSGDDALNRAGGCLQMPGERTAHARRIWIDQHPIIDDGGKEFAEQQWDNIGGIPPRNAMDNLAPKKSKRRRKVRCVTT